MHMGLRQLLPGDLFSKTVLYLSVSKTNCPAVRLQKLEAAQLTSAELSFFVASPQHLEGLPTVHLDNSSRKDHVLCLLHCASTRLSINTANQLFTIFILK